MCPETLLMSALAKWCSTLGGESPSVRVVMSAALLEQLTLSSRVVAILRSVIDMLLLSRCCLRVSHNILWRKQYFFLKELKYYLCRVIVSSEREENVKADIFTAYRALLTLTKPTQKQQQQAAAESEAMEVTDRSAIVDCYSTVIG